MVDYHKSTDKNVDMVINLGIEYNQFIQTNTIIDHLSASLKKYCDLYQNIFEPINKIDNGCLTFSYLKRNFKITLSVLFYVPDNYRKRIIFSEIKNNMGYETEKEIRSILLYNDNCIITKDIFYDTPAIREKLLFEWLNEYINKEFKVNF